MRTLSRFAAVSVAAILSMAIAPIGRASTVYSFGVNSQTPPQAGLDLSAHTGANSFTIGPAQIVAVSLYTLECCNLIWNGSIDYFFFANSGFTPASAPFAQGQADFWKATTIYSDSGSNRVIKYDFNLTAPVSVNAGTYWLGITLTNGFFADPSWNAAVPVGGLSASAVGTNFSNWTLQGQQGAFALFDTPFAIPEPGGASIMVLGLASLLFLGWKTKGFHFTTRARIGPSIAMKRT